MALITLILHSSLVHNRCSSDRVRPSPEIHYFEINLSWLLTLYQSRRHSFVHHAARPADQTSAGSFLWTLILRIKERLTRPRRHMLRRKTRTKLQKQKKMTLSSLVISPLRQNAESKLRCPSAFWMHRKQKDVSMGTCFFGFS